MGAYDWATGSLQGTVNLLRANNLKIIALPDGTSPGAPDGGNAGNLPDNVAQNIQNMGYIADSIMYDEVAGGPADVNTPFTIGTAPLASSGNTGAINLVGYYSAKLVARLLNEGRMIQSVAGQSGFKVDQLIRVWNSDTMAWLAKVRDGTRALQLDRGVQSVPGYGAISGVAKPPTQYPGVPQRPVAWTIPGLPSTPNGPGIVL